MEYYLLINCANCDEEIYYGPCYTSIEHNGKPTVLADEGAQTRFDCEKCGKSTYTGDLDTASEDDM